MPIDWCAFQSNPLVNKKVIELLLPREILNFLRLQVVSELIFRINFRIEVLYQ